MTFDTADTIGPVSSKAGPRLVEQADPMAQGDRTSMSRTQPTGFIRTETLARGTVHYAQVRRTDGRVTKVRLGKAWTKRSRPPEGYITRQQAEAELGRILRGERDDVNVQPLHITFRAVCDEFIRYISEDRKRRASTVRDYRNAIDKVLIPEFGKDTPADEIRGEDIEAFRRRMLDDGKLSARTINKYLVLLHGIFKRAQRSLGLPTNPAFNIERQPIQRSMDIEVLTPGDIAQLAANAANEQDAALYTFAAYSGLRMGELFALKWGDIDWAKRLVHVRRSLDIRSLEEGPTKSGKVRSVPLIDHAARAVDGLSRHREIFTEPDDLVFCNVVGGHLDDDTTRKRFYKSLDAAALRRVRFHDLRHTFGTLAVQAFPLTDVKGYMGHADISTTMVYVHHVPRHDAADKLSALVNAAEQLAAEPGTEPGTELATARTNRRDLSEPAPA